MFLGLVKSWLGSPPGHLRWRQAMPGRVEVTWGGGEANVCASLAMFGQSVRYLTALPRHAIADSLVATLRGLGVDTSHVLWRDAGRLGLYFVEAGANQRGSTVLYDRDDSAVSLAGPDEYAFDAALAGVHWLHVTGITPSLSEAACRSTLELVRRAKQAGATVSCDLNFRKKLWNWRPGTDKKALARECMSDVLQHVDLVIANEEDAADVLGIHAEGTDVERGTINAAAYEKVAREIAAAFPTSRASRSRCGRASRPTITTGAGCCSTPMRTGLFWRPWTRAAITARTRSATSSTAWGPAIRSRPG